MAPTARSRTKEGQKLFRGKHIEQDRRVSRFARGQFSDEAPANSPNNALVVDRWAQ
jgi:hypothetical protein